VQGNSKTIHTRGLVDLWSVVDTFNESRRVPTDNLINLNMLALHPALTVEAEQWLERLVELDGLNPSETLSRLVLEEVDRRFSEILDAEIVAELAAGHNVDRVAESQADVIHLHARVRH